MHEQNLVSIHFSPTWLFSVVLFFLRECCYSRSEVDVFIIWNNTQCGPPNHKHCVSCTGSKVDKYLFAPRYFQLGWEYSVVFEDSELMAGLWYCVPMWSELLISSMLVSGGRNEMEAFEDIFPRAEGSMEPCWDFWAILQRFWWWHPWLKF